MLDKICHLDEIRSIGERSEGFIYPSFINLDQIEQIRIECKKTFIQSLHKKKIDGMVGVAYERFIGEYICQGKKERIPMLYKLLEDTLFSLEEFSDYSEKWCAALVQFKALDGMTSHKDYSYNQNMLGTVVLDGSVLFGSALTREEAYKPENTILASSGDFIGLKAPQDKTERPYFSVLSPTKSLMMRLWMRDQSICCKKGEKK